MGNQTKKPAWGRWVTTTATVRVARASEVCQQDLAVLAFVALAALDTALKGGC
jgi:hypothetical protein